jgi:hypothetical protein
MKNNYKEEIYSEVHKAIEVAGYNHFNKEQLANNLVAFIKERTFIKPMTWKEWVVFYVKYAIIGALRHIPHYLFTALIFYFGFYLLWPLTYWQCFGLVIILRAFKVGIINQKSLTPEEKNK